MQSINERFRNLRIACDKSQEEFGKILGLSRSGVSEIESGRRNVTEQHLIMLKNWAEKSVNIEWIRTGKGEMFNPLTRNQVITDFAGDLMKEEDCNFKKRLIEALAKLDESEWIVLEKLATQLSKKEPGENP